MTSNSLTSTGIPSHPADNRAYLEQESLSRARWLRAGGKLEEWDNSVQEDVSFAMDILDLGENDTVLNIGCGWGQHAITLAYFGHKVIGVEISSHLLKLAQETSQEAGVLVEWVQGDISDAQLSKPVSAVVQFHGNLLNWADGPTGALHQLFQAHAVLEEQGQLLFGSPEWVEEPVHRNQGFSKNSDGEAVHRHFFDTKTRTAQSQTIITGTDGTTRELWRRNWHPTGAQMESLLYQAGFIVLAKFNDFRPFAYSAEHPGLVWLAAKR
ncbi:MAG: class I SAM-dependent methyltransferase [Chloroflexota bacterium]